MKKVRLGATDYEVSVLGLGCINFGTTVEEEQAFRLMDKYVELGGNLFDTANNYAVWNGGDGRDSERVIGKWIKNHPMLRPEIFLCTKLGARNEDNRSGFEAMQGTGRKVILSEVEKSLEALQTNYLDMLYLHVDDWKTPQEETMEALAEVIKKGYVKTIGCSNFRTWRIEKAREICRKQGYPFFSAVQQRYSYLQPVMDAEFGVQVNADKELESYIEYYKDLTMVSHTSLLYGAYFKNNIEDEQYDTLMNHNRLRAIRESGENPVNFVLKHMTSQYGGCVALVTSGNVAHLEQNIKIFDEAKNTEKQLT